MGGAALRVGGAAVSRAAGVAPLRAGAPRAVGVASSLTKTRARSGAEPQSRFRRPPVPVSAGSGSGAGPAMASRVCFAVPGPGGDEAAEPPGRRQGKVTVRYDRRELRKRLHLEEWILQQLTALYDCPEEEIPELEIDVDELLDMESDGARSARVQEILVDCYKPTEAFVVGLLEKIRGLQKLNTPRRNDPPPLPPRPPLPPELRVGEGPPPPTFGVSLPPAMIINLPPTIWGFFWGPPRGFYWGGGGGILGLF
ncbi:uncharacterized protein LOC136000264 [Caloenas nicobarica]|uniref:uncharacterized protein LOC136000264 n=1 Tax=Caloenas nicobarica TaxID=187106 RepID=UPI0032B76E3B